MGTKARRSRTRPLPQAFRFGPGRPVGRCRDPKGCLRCSSHTAPPTAAPAPEQDCPEPSSHGLTPPRDTWGAVLCPLHRGDGHSSGPGRPMRVLVLTHVLPAPRRVCRGDRQRLQKQICTDLGDPAFLVLSRMLVKKLTRSRSRDMLNAWRTQRCDEFRPDFTNRERLHSHTLSQQRGRDPRHRAVGSGTRPVRTEMCYTTHCISKTSHEK